MNWWLMLLSAVLGFVLTWLWMVRRATREVPRQPVSREPGAGVATGGAAAGAVGLVGAGAATLDRDPEEASVFDQEAPSWGRDAATIGAAAAATKSMDVPGAAPIDPDVMHPVELEGEFEDLPEVEAAGGRPAEESSEESLDDMAMLGDTPPEITYEPVVDEPVIDDELVAAPSAGIPTEAAGPPDTASETDPTAYDAEDSDYVPTEAATDEVTVDDAEPEPEEFEVEQFEAGGVSPAGTDGEYAEAPAATEGTEPAGVQAPYGPGSAAADADGSGPEGWLVKGNADSMLFHTQESPGYGRTRAEVWFQDEASATSAGFQHWDRKRRGGLTSTLEPSSGGASPAGPTAAEVTGGVAREDVGASASADGPVTEAASAEAVAPEVAAAVVADAPYGPGSASAAEDGSGPAGWNVKGNANSMLFHTQESPSYGKTRAQVWFQDEESATAAGFAHWDRKRR